MRPRRDDSPLPAEVEAELQALDAALAGQEAPAGMEGLGALVSDLRAERSSPDPEFGAALDNWAAAGFPRGARPGLSERATASDPGGRARLLLASLTPRRLAYVGGAAATLVVLIVSVSQVNFGTDTDDSGSAGRSSIETAPAPTVDTDDAGAPPVTDKGNQEFRAAGGDATQALSAPDPASPGAGGQETRRVERDAQLTLAAPADEVQDVTNDAIDVVEANRGVVLSSQASDTRDSARATLQLQIPTRNLDAALDQLSDLGDVKSLSEGSVDITRPFVDAKDRLAGFRAERRSVLTQIERADTQEELDALKLRLADLNDAIARAEAEFDTVRRRAALSSVTLQITSQGAGDGDGDWSFGDALDDAGRVLTVAAGVALISAAVLLPLTLIAAIAYLVLSATRRRARERALDE